MVDKEPTLQRYTLVDALRGIAAFAVLCHHLFHNSSLERPLWRIFPTVISEFCHFGSFGVQIFFVLSGFVIPHSLRNVRFSTAGLGNFLVRRQLRLDPPYWTVVLLTLAVSCFEQMTRWVSRPTPVGFLDTLKNLFYLQNLTGAPQIVDVAWTLCLEVQFYLVLIVLLVAGKYLTRKISRIGDVSVLLVTALGIFSLLMPRHVWNAWFFQWWYYFAAGVLCYWATQQPKLRPVLMGYLALFLVVSIWQDPPPMLTGLTTVVLLYVAGRLGGLTSWLDYPVLQYLGRISYSLYLIHLLVARYVLRLGFRVTGDSPAGALFWFLLAIGVSILAGHILYITVEKRSMRFASSLKRDPSRSTEGFKAATPEIETRTPVAANG